MSNKIHAISVLYREDIKEMRRKLSGTAKCYIICNEHRLIYRSRDTIILTLPRYLTYDEIEIFTNYLTHMTSEAPLYEN